LRQIQLRPIERNHRRSYSTSRISRLRSGWRWREDDLRNGSVIYARFLSLLTAMRALEVPYTWNVNRMEGSSLWLTRMFEV
jgi:hypothetical protein